MSVGEKKGEPGFLIYIFLPSPYYLHCIEIFERSLRFPTIFPFCFASFNSVSFIWRLRGEHRITDLYRHNRQPGSKLPPRTPLSSIFLTKSTRAFLSLWRLVNDIYTSEKESDETLDKRPVDVLDNDCYQMTWSAVTKLNERALFGVMSTRILMKRRCAWEIN